MMMPLTGSTAVVLLQFAAPALASPPAVTDIRQDLARFDSLFGLPAARLQVVVGLRVDATQAARGFSPPEPSSSRPRCRAGHVVEPEVVVRATIVEAVRVRIVVEPAGMDPGWASRGAVSPPLRPGCHSGLYWAV